MNKYKFAHGSLTVSVEFNAIGDGKAQFSDGEWSSIREWRFFHPLWLTEYRLSPDDSGRWVLYARQWVAVK